MVGYHIGPCRPWGYVRRIRAFGLVAVDNRRSQALGWPYSRLKLRCVSTPVTPLKGLCTVCISSKAAQLAHCNGTSNGRDRR